MSAASPRSGLADGIDAALDSARVVEHHGGQKYNDLERQLADALLRLFEQLEACEADRNSLSKSADYLQEQLEALKMQERANARAFEDSEREVERLREQLETALRERDENAAQALRFASTASEILNFLVAVVEAEWGPHTGPYTGDFEPMNAWVESNPASRWPGATAFYRSVPNQDSDPEARS